MELLQFESILLVNIVSLPGNPFTIWVLQTPALKKSRSSCRMWRKRGRESKFSMSKVDLQEKVAQNFISKISSQPIHSIDLVKL